MDVTNWQEEPEASAAEAPVAEREPEPISSGDPELEAFRRQLEGLL